MTRSYIYYSTDRMYVRDTDIDPRFDLLNVNVRGRPDLT